MMVRRTDKPSGDPFVHEDDVDKTRDSSSPEHCVTCKTILVSCMRCIATYMRMHAMHASVPLKKSPDNNGGRESQS